jgi:hypothetical protein
MTIAKRSILGLVLVVAVGCGEKGMGYGDPNSIVAVVADERWDEISADVYDAFEKTITTVRDEKTFTVTYQEPFGEHWMNLRRFRQMLVIGTRADAWVQEVLDEARRPVATDGVHQVYDVWARGQTVTLVLLPDGWSADALRPMLSEIHAMLDGQYRDYAMNRMYFSGADSALADTLSTEHGFALLLPQVYRWSRADSIFVFRNDNPDPSELIREVVVTWWSPAVSRPTTEQVLERRAQLVTSHYSEPQDIVLEGMLQDTVDVGGRTAYQIQAQWRNPPERGWPAGGPFITRVLTCEGQNRTYLIDAWLYAPGKEKYEYMIQLETVLNSFRCGSS